MSDRMAGERQRTKKMTREKADLENADMVGELSFEKRKLTVSGKFRISKLHDYRKQNPSIRQNLGERD